ncbi:MAG: helix-turn-helix transcriptional regulator [Erysipelotrichaceae bacterium]
MDLSTKDEKELKMSEEDIKIKLGIKIRSLRQNKNLSQEQLSALTKLHRNYISDVERGQRNISIVAIYRIAEGLDIEIKDLF